MQKWGIISYNIVITKNEREAISMQLTIRNIGNSSGLILPRNVLDRYSLSNHDMVELTMTEDGMFVKPIIQKKKRRSIQELFANYDGGFIEENEVDFGMSVGKEVW